ncbi:hypothetical protein CTheo_8963 [Ceratobasidium theobromae]|uniref:Uncharacterized protein n=1 Tax=Ceratobasidium theobromae TaxID=1582974 RepID=A0A5N5Q876_9AGAM|nr:hypothetical protein CTheo_8963 [Ceratobasidium theobromae]
MYLVFHVKKYELQGHVATAPGIVISLPDKASGTLASETTEPLATPSTSNTSINSLLNTAQYTPDLGSNQDSIKQAAWKKAAETLKLRGSNLKSTDTIAKHTELLECMALLPGTTDKRGLYMETTGLNHNPKTFSSWRAIGIWWMSLPEAKKEEYGKEVWVSKTHQIKALADCICA